MKKQLFILILALFAATTAFGQSLAPRVLDCAVTDGPLNPLLGKTYTYSVDVPNSADFTGSGGITYQWRVTTDKTFITGGAITATALTPGAANEFEVASGTYNVANSSDQIQISWNALSTETDPFFLLVNVVGDNGVCTPQNMKVYMIIPVNQFTLDIANVDVSDNSILDTWQADGSAELFEQCVQDVQSVSWKAGSNEAIYDYGSNTLIWAVVAANWSDSWTPTLQLTGVNAGELIESVTWSRTPTGAAGGTFSLSGTDWVTTDVVTPSGVGSDVGAAGETIYIRVVLDHTDVTSSTFFEGLVDQDITLAIDGETANGDPDVHYSDTLGVTPGCGDADGFDNDTAEQTLKARPGINTNTEPPAGTEPLLTPVFN